MAIHGFGHSTFCTKDRLYYCKYKVANGLHSTDRDQLPVSSDGTLYNSYYTGFHAQAHINRAAGRDMSDGLL